MRDEYREVNKGLSLGVIWAIIITIVIALGGVAWWAISVATADIKGEGDKIIEQQSAENFIRAQAFFEDTYADYEATLVKIEIAREALAADPGNQTLTTNLTGVQNHCTNVVADYNAESNKYLSEDFKAADLPESLDPRACL